MTRAVRASPGVRAARAERGVPPWQAVLPPLATVLFALLLLAHLGLIPAGQWEGDEWLNFFLFRTEGTGFLVHRILYWSPRPVSETLVFLYAGVVDAVHRPLVTPLLGLLWALPAAAAAALVPGPALTADPALIPGPARNPGPAPSHDPALVPDHARNPGPDRSPDRSGRSASRIDDPTFAGTTPSSIAPRPEPTVTPSGGRFARALAALAVLTFFLLGHQVAEMFYWPMGAVAYVPAIAALTLLVMLVLRGRHLSRSGAALSAATMVAAAGSAEVGAMAVGAISVLLAGVELRRAPRRAALLMLPLAAALLVFALILHGRAADGVALGAETATIHALWPSLAAAAMQFAHETLSLDAYPDGLPGLALGTATKLALFLGLRALCRLGLAGSPTPRAHLWCLVAGLLAASFLSIAAAFWQFGLVCCQRHDSFRQCLDVLVLLLLAALAARPRQPRYPGHASPGSTHPVRAGPHADAPAPGALHAATQRRLAAGSAWLLLAAGLSLSHRGPLMRRLPALRADYRHVPAMLAARNETWSSGLAPGSGMVFREPPQGFVVGETDWPTGAFSLDRDPPWFMKGILLYYAKQHLDAAATPHR